MSSCPQIRFVSFALCGALSIFIVFEYLRVARVPPIADQIDAFIQVLCCGSLLALPCSGVSGRALESCGPLRGLLVVFVLDACRSGLSLALLIAALTVVRCLCFTCLGCAAAVH